MADANFYVLVGCEEREICLCCTVHRFGAKVVYVCVCMYRKPTKIAAAIFVFGFGRLLRRKAAGKNYPVKPLKDIC
jgi:hypothetical protein